jgi:hypothetical protein
MSNDHTYSYGSSEETTVVTRLQGWVARNFLSEFIDWILDDDDRLSKLRNFVFHDEELNLLFHQWLEEELGWPIDKDDPENFWKVKFARRFGTAKQCEHLRDYFDKKVRPLLDTDEGEVQNYGTKEK